MNEITLDSFNETLDELVKANPHAKNKGDNFKKWCLDNFNIDARISYIKSQQQITNRVSEQFRYFAPFVVFVCSKDVKIETVTKYILERIYAKLQCVALIVVNTLPKENVQDKALIYCFETLFIFKHSDLSKWALQYFCQIKEGSTLLKKTLSSYDDSQFDGGITPVIYYGPLFHLRWDNRRY